MRRVAISSLAVAAVLAAMPVLAPNAFAQEIVPAAPSNSQAVAAGDVATVAVAQINDQADAAATTQKVELYKQLMELNGMSRNIRTVLDTTKTTTRLIVIQRSGTATLTPEQDARYNQIADGVLKDTESKLIDEIATTQAASYSADEIKQLIASNSSVAAAKYNAAKFVDESGNASQVENYMVEAVIKIMKSFKESVAS
jgi:hypothetical protein